MVNGLEAVMSDERGAVLGVGFWVRGDQAGFTRSLELPTRNRDAQRRRFESASPGADAWGSTGSAAGFLVLAFTVHYSLFTASTPWVRGGQKARKLSALYLESVCRIWGICDTLKCPLVGVATEWSIKGLGGVPILVRP